MTSPTAIGTRQRAQGALVGGLFGCVFLLVNARTPLGPAAADAFRALGVAGLLALIAGRQRVARRTRPTAPADGDRAIGLFGRRWRMIVAAEIAALAAGFAVIAAIGAPSETYLPWTVVVVGAHFVAFDLFGVWEGTIIRAGAALMLLGIAGLVLAAASETDWIPLISGVLPGVVILGGSLAAMRGAARVHDADMSPRRSGYPMRLRGRRL